MKRNIAVPRLVVTAIALAAFFAPLSGFAQQSGSPTGSAANSAASPDTPQTPLTPRAKEELHARILMATKQYPEAAKAYQQLAVENPRDSSYPNFAGIAMMQLNDLDGARKQFERATKINKKFAAAYNNIGAIYFAQKQYRKAIRQYEKALSIEEQTAGFYSNLGYAYFGEKRFPEAFKSFQKALSLDPNTFQQNDRNGALLQYRSVSDHGLFDFMLAKSYAQMGDAQNCATYLRRAVDDGYKEVASARTDPAFVKVLTDPDVKTVLDQVAPPETKPPATPPGA
jgi:tetratricopeptide (TPR) repeat protein